MGATVQCTAPDGVADAYLTRPDDEPHPGVLYITDAFGLRPTTEEMADRIAANGYVVLAPNVFYRAGRAPLVQLGDLMDPEQRTTTFQAMMPLIRQLTPARLAADGAAYLSCLGEVASPGPVGITGYCMGGRVGWWITAAHPDRVVALAAFHTAGMVTGDPNSPHRSAAAIESELYFGFADEDPNMTAEQIAVLEEALDAVGVRYRLEVVTGALHGYTMADLPVFDEAARDRHFRTLRPLFARTLG